MCELRLEGNSAYTSGMCTVRSVHLCTIYKRNGNVDVHHRKISFCGLFHQHDTSVTFWRNSAIFWLKCCELTFKVRGTVKELKHLKKKLWKQLASTCFKSSKTTKWSDTRALVVFRLILFGGPGPAVYVWGYYHLISSHTPSSNYELSVALLFTPLTHVLISTQYLEVFGSLGSRFLYVWLQRVFLSHWPISAVTPLAPVFITALSLLLRALAFCGLYTFCELHKNTP